MILSRRKRQNILSILSLGFALKSSDLMVLVEEKKNAIYYMEMMGSIVHGSNVACLTRKESWDLSLIGGNLRLLLSFIKFSTNWRGILMKQYDFRGIQAKFSMDMLYNK